MAFETAGCDMASCAAFHNVADRWPEAIDIALLARYARALANGALELARETG
jgi:hypothetical protein